MSDLTDLIGSEPGKHVYFVVDASAEAVKIGMSNSPQQRLKTLQPYSANELRLIKVIPNSGGQLEQYLHSRFANDRLHDEWFRLTGEIQGFINAIESKPIRTPIVPIEEIKTQYQASFPRA